MSRNVAIQEGGIARTLSNVRRIEVDLQGGGTTLLVPEDEYDGITKYISANGTYEAADEGHYAYTEVEVSIPGSAGNIPGGIGCSIVGLDELGNDLFVEVGDDGTLDDMVLPVRIEIVTPPAKTTYSDGEAIDITGINVVAYGPDGNVMQFVPQSELVIDPTTADGSSIYSTIYSDGNGVTARLIEYTFTTFTYVVFGEIKEGTTWGYLGELAIGKGYHGGDAVPLSLGRGDGAASLLITRFHDGTRFVPFVLRVSGDNSSVGMIELQTRPPSSYDGWVGGAATTASSHTDRWEDLPYDLTNLPISSVSPSVNNPMMDSMHAIGMQIEVGWSRPGDGKMLYDRFAIEIARTNASGSGGSTSNGGGEGGGGGGGGAY